MITQKNYKKKTPRGSLHPIKDGTKSFKRGIGNRDLSQGYQGDNLT